MTPLDPNTSLRTSRVIKAPREKVFDAFVVPELRMQWWAANLGDRCTLCEIDGRVGGRYRINMITSEHEFLVSGIFNEFVRPEKLVFTWTWELPSGDVKDSLVTMLFQAIDRQTTELILIHERLVSPELRDLHSAGWNGCLAALAAHVEPAA